jgi:hypothetical protein
MRRHDEQQSAPFHDAQANQLGRELESSAAPKTYLELSLTAYRTYLAAQRVLWQAESHLHEVTRHLTRDQLAEFAEQSEAVRRAQDREDEEAFRREQAQVVNPGQ